MLTWNVFCEDFNAKTIVVYNVFDHGYFRDECRKAAKKHKDDRDAFSKAVKSAAMYYFWCKCEWEIIISDWPPSPQERGFRDIKVDVYSQLKMNWDIFIDYIMSNRKNL